MPERVLLFCLASDTDWVKAGVTHSIAQHLMVKNLVERHGSAHYVLTEQGRAVLFTLLPIETTGNGRSRYVMLCEKRCKRQFSRLLGRADCREELQGLRYRA